ncbi:GNAT family N-acetyltransferase [Streptomyces sp. NPDC051018]|uniref:GNAT family N-acetyltransferase n=1 Tax=Streptomyces sp. NPDC051018 TaxID=3365639 RepID=UPI003796E33C
MTLETRSVSVSDYPGWLRALSTGFLRSPALAEGEAEARSEGVDLSRAAGVYDGGRCVATYRSFDQRLTVPGGAAVAANAVTNVSVTATHRRRGILGRLMTADLRAARERGDAVATLISAEYPIYGRYGFGPATWTAEWSVDIPRAGIDSRLSGQPADGGRVDLADLTEVRKEGPELHTRFSALQPGAVSRDERWWRLRTGVTRFPDEPWTEPFHAVYRSASGEIEGLAVYRVDDTWGDAKQPLNTATVSDLLALTPAAERALWGFLCSIDWITTVRTGYRAPDDLLPSLLPDPRAARTVTHADFLWVRILDAVRALEARTYDTAAALVLDVRDPLGLTAGRFLLETGPDGASCVPTAQSPDLTLDVRELGALYLGDESPVRLKALGTLEENRPGAASTADRLFRTPRRPWCPDIF